MKASILFLTFFVLPTLSFASTYNPLQYANDTIKNYSGIDITGKTSTNDSNILIIGKNVLGKMTQRKSGNIFQDLMYGSLFEQPIEFGANSIYANNPDLVPIDPKTNIQKNDSNTVDTSFLTDTSTDTVSGLTTYSKDDLDKSKASVFKNGKLDPFACMMDPICSKF